MVPVKDENLWQTSLLFVQSILVAKILDSAETVVEDPLRIRARFSPSYT